MDPRETELIERVLAGDAAAFEPLVTPYRGALLALAYRLAGNSEDAKEIAQEALLRAFRYLRSCDPGLGFRNWLYQILVNAARGFLRRRAEAQRGLAALARDWDGGGGGEKAESAHERAEAGRRLRQCLDALSEREREVFWLREIEELSVEETARVLGSSSISVRVHLNRARRKVQDVFRERYAAPDGGSR